MTKLRYTWHIIVVPLTILLAGMLLPAYNSNAQITPLGQRGCARGTIVGGPNLVVNGDFSIDPGPGPGIDPQAGFTNDLLNRGPNKYPDDGGGGGFSIQTGPQVYFGGLLQGRPFPGDTARNIAPSQTYFYSNPVWNPGVKELLLWRQQVQVVGGTTYNFFAYFDNLLVPESGAADPLIELRVDGIAAGPPIQVGESPDQWAPIEYAFTTRPEQQSVTLSIYDLAADSFGDDFGMTQINLKQCVSGLGVAKQAQFLGRNLDGSYGVEYKITLQNFGVDPEPLRSVQVTDDLTRTFTGASGFQVISVTSPLLAVNPAYDGKTTIELLGPNNFLAAQQSATIRIVVHVLAGTGPNGAGPFKNTAIASATAGNIAVTDPSSPGIQPDPNSSGDWKSGDRPTEVELRGVVSLPLLHR